MLKTLILLPFKVAFYICFWPLLVVRKFWKIFAVLFFASLLGCASLDKSPCACDFEPINVSHDGGQHA